MSDQLARLPQLKPIADHHTSPEQAAEVFRRTKPKLAAYSHVILLGTDKVGLMTRTKSHYTGDVEVGEDLMRFEIGENVVVKQWNTTLRRYPKQ